MKSPGLALILSFFIPGLGQLYNEKVRDAITFIVSYICSVVLCIVIIGFIIAPIIWIYSMYDAYKGAKKINAGQI